MRLPGTTGMLEKTVMNLRQQGSRRERFSFPMCSSLYVHNLPNCRDCLFYPGILFCWRFLPGSCGFFKANKLQITSHY